ncbi:outer membrane usher protein [Erwinia sp. Eh17-17]|uniref:outer membrane usher protein n=1 Tax=Erwinia sp. Eh17-17 TaxID=3080330 RepID=UPI0032084E62
MFLYSTESVSRVKIVSILVFIALASPSVYSADNIQFNMDILDVNDKKNIDLSRFSRRGYIMPGAYNMDLHINKNEVPDQPVNFYPPDDDPSGSEACITHEQLELLGLKPEIAEKLTWWHDNQCLNPDSIKGTSVHADLSEAALYLSIPQAYLEYSSDDWEPPSHWDNGIPGLLLDYNVNAQSQHQQHSGSNYNVSGNGTLGANLGAWRFRANWQARMEKYSGSKGNTRTNWDWSQYYAYRAIASLRSKLTLGENYLNSDLFDSFRFTGVTLASDDKMLPPNLRGYAPEVVGIARTNAKVTVSQQGRVLYETQVASGPFRIQDLNDAVTGDLMVRVEEEDGSVQEFKVTTANVPYLTRPGTIRFKIAAGKPSDFEHHSRGPLFGTGEFSWGISNGWSMYGGALVGNNYNALSFGVGRDLMIFGALALDATQSWAHLPQTGGTLKGGSYRLSYSKTFEEIDSQVTFAGYRFSQKDFMSMSEYLDARYYGTRQQSNKEMYTITFNKQFRDSGLSAYLNYSHQTYWNRPTTDRYSMTLSRYFDIWKFKNASASLSAFRNKYNGRDDNGMYLSLSLPLSTGASLSYNLSVNGRDTSHTVGYYDRVDENNSYQLQTGISRNGGQLSGYYDHEGDIAHLSANASYKESEYSSVGISAQGGATITPKGGALHPVTTEGATRLLLDTQGVADIPVAGYGAAIRTNSWGKAVVGNISDYYHNQVRIDINNLPENAEATKSVVQATLTEGAIGYRKFSVISGMKMMAIIRLGDGSYPPFGSEVFNRRKQQTGIINDNGSVYITGVNPGESMTVNWDGKAQCEVEIPVSVSKYFTQNLLLPCTLLKETISLKENEGEQ